VIWRYIALWAFFVALLAHDLMLVLRTRRLRKQIKELEDYILNERPGNLVRQRNRLGGGPIFPW
jgi:hypothetical protein